MAIAFVKAAQNFNAGSVNTLTVTISSSAGSLLVIMVRLAGDAASPATTTWTVTDSAAQSWTQTSHGYVNSGTVNARGSMHYIENSAALTSVTINFSATITGPAAVVFEISGAALSSSVDSDVNADSAGSGETNMGSGSLTTTNANDILIYGVWTASAAGGFTGDTGGGFTVPANGTANDRIAMQYKVVSATQSALTTLISTVNVINGGGVFIAFKAASTAFVDEDYKWGMQLLPSDPSITVFQ